MRWNTSPPKEEQPYKRWFAWYPTKLGGSDWVWLEWVERRVFYPFIHTKHGWFYIYKDLGEQ